MIYVLNKREEIIDILEPNKERSYRFDLHVQDLKEGSETLEFDTDVDIPENSTIVLRTLSGDLHPFIVQKIRRYSSDTFEKTYSCDAEFLELRYTRILEPQKLDGQTADTALQFALQGTRWQMGVVDAGDVRDIEIPDYMNVLKFIRMLAAEFDLEMRFRTEFSANTISARYVDLVQRAGIDMGKEIVFGKDIQSIERIEDTSAVVTALYGVGPADDNGVIMTIAAANGGKVYVEDMSALQRWSKDGEHRYDVYTPPVDADELTPWILFELTKKELERRISSIVTYKVDAVDFYDVFGYEHERVFLGDTVRIKDTKWEHAPLYLEARVIKIERSYTDPSRNKYELGDFREIDIKTYKYIREIQNVLNRNKEKWNKAEENANEYADGVSTAAYNSAVADAQAWAEANGVMQGETYNGVSISNTDGFLTVRGDQLVRTVMNSTKGIIIQKRYSVNDSWRNIFYVDTNGKLYVVDATLSGELVIDSIDSMGNIIKIGEGKVKTSFGDNSSFRLSAWLTDNTMHFDYENDVMEEYANGSITETNLGLTLTDSKQINLNKNTKVTGNLTVTGTINGSVSSASYADYADYAAAAGTVDTGYAYSNGEYKATVPAKSVSHQGITFEFLSNGTLVATHEDGRYATFVPDSKTF